MNILHKETFLPNLLIINKHNKYTYSVDKSQKLTSFCTPEKEMINSLMDKKYNILLLDRK